jgi:hypothetical protein
MQCAFAFVFVHFKVRQIIELPHHLSVVASDGAVLRDVHRRHFLLIQIQVDNLQGMLGGQHLTQDQSVNVEAHWIALV